MFFALWPAEPQRAALMHALDEVARHCDGRMVPAENLHVTLAFLGAVPESGLALLSSLARRAAGSFASHALPLSLTFASLAYWAKPRVLAALEHVDAASAHAGATTLAGTLTRETAAAGFTPDLKPFRAHVTVARKVTHSFPETAMHAVHWSFAEFALIESRTRANGPVYSVIDSYLLGETEKVRR